jgi:hypothetical protein
MRQLFAASCLLMLGASGLGGEKPDAEKQVRAGIIKFRTELRSDDEKVRMAALDRGMVDKKLVEKLFGKPGAQLWPRMAKMVEMMRGNTARLKKELDEQGQIKKVQLIDVRKKDISGRYRQVLTMIPKDIPVYRAVIDAEKRTSGSSSYLLVDGVMRWFPGLESIARSIAKLKEVAVFEKLSKRFLAAMRSEKLEDAMGCWLTREQRFELMKNRPPWRPKPTEENLGTIKRYMETRDAVIRAWFPDLIKKLKEKKLAPKDLSYAASRGTVSKKGSSEKTSSIRMTFKHKNGGEVNIRIDDGFKYKGEWKFSDKPLDVEVVKGGKSEHLDVKDRPAAITSAGKAGDEAPKAFVRRLVQSLIDGGGKPDFAIAGKVVAVDNGEVITRADLVKAWPEFAKRAFKKKVTLQEFFARVDLRVGPVTDNKRLMANKRVLKVYKHQKGDLFCDASRVKAGIENCIGYEKAFIYVIRKVDGKWTLIGIGG